MEKRHGFGFASPQALKAFGLEVIVERIRRGLIVPGATPSQGWRADALLAVDGAFGFGPHVAMRADRKPNRFTCKTSAPASGVFFVSQA